MSPLPALLRRVAVVALGAVLLRSATGRALASWQLVWSDEFNGSNVDTTNWTFDTGNGSGGWGNGELEYCTSRATNVYISNGLLNIVARKENYQELQLHFGQAQDAGPLQHPLWPVRVPREIAAGHGLLAGVMVDAARFGLWRVGRFRGSGYHGEQGPDSYPKSWAHSITAPYSRASSIQMAPSYTFPGGDSVTNFHVYAMEWTTNQFSW